MDAPEGDAAASSYEAQQAALAAIMGPLVAAAVRQISLADLEQSLTVFGAQVVGLVRKYGQVAAVHALQWYQKDRAAHGVGGTLRVSLPAPLPASNILAELDVSDLFVADDPATVVHKVSDGVAATADRIALSQGDETVQDAVDQDRHAIGYARGLEAGACGFCSMLASAGAVYNSEDSAAVKVHDNCHCYPIPVYAGEQYVPGHREQRAQDLWKTAVTDKHLTGADARRAYRAAIEGREYIPRKTKPGTSGDKTVSGVAAGLSPQDRDALIAKLRASEGACKKAGLVKTLAAVRARIAELEQASGQQHHAA